MIIRLAISNFLSIQRRIEISFEAKPLKERDNLNVFSLSDHSLNLVKGIAFYGLNSAGKSNIIRSIAFMKNFVLNSFNELRANEKIRIQPFKLSENNHVKPSLFEVEMIAGGSRYVYGFELSSDRIHREWLDHCLKTTKRNYFTRNEDHLKIKDGFREGWNRKDFLRPNALFLSTMAQLGEAPVSTSIFGWFQNLIIISDLNYMTFLNQTANRFEDSKYKSYLKKFFVHANLGFEDIEIKKIQNEESNYQYLPDELRTLILKRIPFQLQISTIHNKYNDKGKLTGTERLDFKSHESQGTQKFFSFLGPTIDSLINSKILIIDELDSRLHPGLSQIIVEVFFSNLDNPNNAQLIFSTHNLSILKNKLLRRDQIYYVFKNALQSTEIRTFLDFGVRSDSSYEAEFLKADFEGVVKLKGGQLKLFE